MFTRRRKFLTYLSAIGVSLSASQYLFAGSKSDSIYPDTAAGSHHPSLSSADKSLAAGNSFPEMLVRRPKDYSKATENTVAYLLDSDPHVLDNLIETSIPAKLKPVDLVLYDHEIVVLRSVVARLQRLQSFVGYANFNVIGWDQSLKFARNYSDIGAFEKSELGFIEQIFYQEADNMGFYGGKVITQISSTIRRKDIKKIPATGHYLFMGDALKTYEKIRRDIGDNIVLTSGIRSVVKQTYLFLRKTSEVGGNLSTASFSLAPPGYSFHAIGDFDVGKANFGKRNFTIAFAATDEFKKLSDLGYIDIRYPQNNPSGVRYEPWHIKVV